MRLRALSPLLLLVPGACSESGAGVARAGAPSVVLICMDTVRADHLGCYGYRLHATTPALDALAAKSVVFEDASSTAGWTKPSVPSFLTGTYPAQHGVYEGSARAEAGSVSDVLPAASVTLAEVFREHGYRTAAFVRNAQLRPGLGFEQGFDLYRDEAGDAREIRWRGLDWIDEGPRERPFFLYLHLLDAHWPYPVPDEYATRFTDAASVARFRDGDSRALRDAVNHGEIELGAEDRAALEALYDGSIRYIDDELGRFLTGLERRGLGDDTLVCVVSDHGEEFGEHGRIGHGHGLWENLLRVPWLLHVPGAEPRRVHAAVSLVDLFPTLLGAAGLPAGSTHSGVDRLADPDRLAPVFAEHKAPDRYTQSLRQGDLKLVRRLTPPEKAIVPVLPLALDERWEAEVERDADGALVALQLKPRDEPADDPLEIKGVVSSSSEGSLTIQGLAVRYENGVQIVRTDGAESIDLAPGAWVKVRGEMQGGALAADRIKLYAPDPSLAFEIRGTVAAVEGTPSHGRVRLGDLWVRVDDRTVFKGIDAPEPRMTRAEVLAVLTGGAPFATEAGYELRTWLRQATAQESEVDPQDLSRRLEALDRLGARLAEHRVYSDADVAALSDRDLDALKAIGYVE